MAQLEIRAQARKALGKSVNALRKSQQLPAVVYGHGAASRPITVRRAEFERLYRQAGESTLIDLIVDEAKPVKVIVQDVQRHPTSGAIQHVDLHQVRMTEKLKTDIPLTFVGEAPAVKEHGGVLVKNLDHLEVEALPGDLVHELIVDLSSLKTFDDFIHVRAIALPSGMTTTVGADEVVAVVTPPRSEQELAELEEKVEEKVEEVEGVKKEEAPAEGAAPDASADESEAKPTKKES